MVKMVSFMLCVFYYHFKKSGTFHMMTYYLAIKRNEVLIHATMWMNHENVMLNEGSQSQKTTYIYFKFLFINLFIFSCVGSLLMRAGFL